LMTDWHQNVSSEGQWIISMHYSVTVVLSHCVAFIIRVRLSQAFLERVFLKQFKSNHIFFAQLDPLVSVILKNEVYMDELQFVPYIICSFMTVSIVALLVFTVQKSKKA
jgi:hypothetical protein